jgi:hypothetical protein
MPTYTNPSIDQEISPKQIFYVDNKCAIFTCNGSPEGVILANTGSIALSDNGSVFKKTTDDVTTGWVELTSGTLSSPVNISGTNPTLNLIDTTVGDDDAAFSLDNNILTLTIGANTIVFRNNGQIVGYPRNIRSNSTQVGNVGAGVDVLDTLSIPANSLLANNDYVDYWYSGGFANNANTKRILLTIDGQNIFDSTLFTFNGVPNNNRWSLNGKILRSSATQVIASANVMLGSVVITGAGAVSGNAQLQGENKILTVANLNSNAVALTLSAEATTNDDVTKNSAIMSLTQL